ncbi:MAG: MFS transporter [Desulfobacterales bacterium]|jgi:MFS family permease|nr:MFS transporter [Desulfobacterales bacterium]
MPTDSSGSRAGTIFKFLGLQKSTLAVLGMVVLVGMGERMSERFLPVYLLALGGGALSIGLLNGLDNLLSALYSFPGGYLSDRIGIKRALLVFNLVAMAGFILVIAVPAWQAVILGSVFFISWSSISLPATMGLFARVLPSAKRTMGVSMHAIVTRIPMALGPLLGGFCIAAWGERDGVRLAFGFALAFAVVAIFLQQKLIEEPDRAAGRRSAGQPGPMALWRMMRPGLRMLLASDILIRFCEQISHAFVVVWCMKVIAEPVSAVQFGLLTTIEMATAVLIYIPVAALADRGNKKPFVLVTFVLFTVFPLALLFTHSFAALVPAFVLRGLKEFGEPTRKVLIVDLSPEENKAGMFGLYYLLRDLVVSVAAFGGAFSGRSAPRLISSAHFSSVCWAPSSLRCGEAARSRPGRRRPKFALTGGGHRLNLRSFDSR